MRISDWSSDVCSSDLVLRPEGADAVEAGQGLPRLPHQRTFMRVDHIKTDAFHIINGRHQPHRTDNMRCPCLKPRRRGGIGRLFKRHLVNHRSAALIRRHRSEEHTSELQSLMRISYAVFCLKKKNKKKKTQYKT